MEIASRNEVTLAEILAAREARALRQRDLLAAYPSAPLVCLYVNTPGPVKRTVGSDRVFHAGLTSLLDAFKAQDIALLFSETRRPATGCEAYLVADAAAETLKRVACALETRLPYGRLLDIDVHTQNGTQLSRTALGFPERGCMVCGAVGGGCASRRLHPLLELLAAFDRLAETAPEVRP